jgi:hypothetical protein
MKKLALLVLAAIPGLVNGQISDDFNDGNDNGWTRYDPIGSHPQLPDIATFTMENGGYRIQTAPSPLPGTVGPGRAGSLRNDVTYTDFYMSVDIINWDTNLNQAFGLLARCTQIGLGATDGYSFTWDRGGRDIDISVFTNEVPTGAPGQAGQDRADLVQGKSYRMTFSGKGTILSGEIYELPNLDTPLASLTANSDAWPSGVGGLIVYDNSNQANPARTDTTFDNFFSHTFRPPRLKIEVLPFQEYKMSWQADPPNYVLQYCTQLGVNWTDITENIVEADGRRSFIDSSQEEKRFYRLRP